MEKEELPPDMQQHIPVMEFSAHVYSSNPMQRSIVINGRFMEEGDRLTADLLLDEITADGAIFNFRGQRFHQGVVSAWN
jgi:general secretion pathway protein B